MYATIQSAEGITRVYARHIYKLGDFIVLDKKDEVLEGDMILDKPAGFGIVNTVPPEMVGKHPPKGKVYRKVIKSCKVGMPLIVMYDDGNTNYYDWGYVNWANGTERLIVHDAYDKVNHLLAEDVSFEYL